ncbi:cytochrome P450 [Nemania abortiva]|nr:cytochrome P450 [Nemania abortiva]
MELIHALLGAARYAVAMILPLALLIGTYRLAFHPLRGYPGPFIAKLTDAYGGYQVKRKRLHLKAHSDLRKYGPVYRQGPNRLVFNTVAALRDLSQHGSIHKAHVYTFTSISPVPHVLGTVDPESHRMKRNVYGRVLSGHVYMAWPAIRALNRIVMLLNMPKLLTAGRLLKNIIKRRAAIEENSGRHDFWAVASTSHRESDSTTSNTSIEKSQVWSEALFFFPAGGQTTSCALSAAFFYLSRHPPVYARLAAEIRDAFSDGSLIQGGPQLLGCRYLRAVIDETLRMSPPTTVMPWREVGRHKEPCVIDGHVVPGGTLVAISAYCLMHNEAYFPEPFAFRPERWLDDDDADPDRLARMAEAFIPFSFGETMCLGKTMAYMEISLVLAKTLWHFDFGRAPGEAGKLGGGGPGGWDGGLRDRVDEFQLYDAFVGEHDGPNLTFIPRRGL